MNRFSTWLLASTLTLFWPTPPQPATHPVEQVTVEQAATRIRQVTGHKAVIVFYKTNCPLSQAAFPSLVALAHEQAAAGVVFLVFSVDTEKRMSEVPRFLARYNAPFKPVYIRPWVAGNFTRTIEALGINVGGEFTTPIIAVRNSSGAIVTQGQGVTSVAGLDRVLSAID